MKKIENNFAVTGFVAKDAEVRQFTTTSVARFPLAVARQEKNGEETKRISAFMNIEAWRENENRLGRTRRRAAQPHRNGRRQVLSRCRERGGSSCGTGKEAGKRQEVIYNIVFMRLIS